MDTSREQAFKIQTVRSGNPAQTPRTSTNARNIRRNAEKRWNRTKKAFNTFHADLTKAVGKLTRRQGQQLQFDAGLRPTAKQQRSRGVRYIGGRAMTMAAITKLAATGVRVGQAVRHAL